MAERIRIPAKVEEQLLFQSDHTCCVCRTKGKDVQIHHIDGEPGNNVAENLAVVCLDCHSLVSGSRGLGKKYKAGEVRRYKRAWEKFVEGTRRIHSPKIGYKKELVSQIDLMVCEILASKNDIRRVRNLLLVLYELRLWRGGSEVNKKIIEGLAHLATMSGLDSNSLGGEVAATIYQICWHFAGPHLVSMENAEAKEVLGCIDALNTLFFFTCGHGHRQNNIRKIILSAEQFFQIGLWYSNRRIVNEVIKGYEEALDACYSDKEQLEFRFGLQSIHASAIRIRKNLLKIKPQWSDELGRLEKIVKVEAR
jgi:hypothetical protein